MAFFGHFLSFIVDPALTLYWLKPLKAKGLCKVSAGLTKKKK